jgi:hypothetical protein
MPLFRLKPTALRSWRCLVDNVTSMPDPANHWLICCASSSILEQNALTSASADFMPEGSLLLLCCTLLKKRFLADTLWSL